MIAIVTFNEAITPDKYNDYMKNSLKVERAIMDFTQQQLAELVGVSRQTINAIEKGNYVPSTTLSLKLARVFSKPVENIFQLDEND